MTFNCDNCGRKVDKVNVEGLCPKCAAEEEKGGKKDDVGKHPKRIRTA